MDEIWKPIKNYEGYYEVSNLGNVRSLTRSVNYSSGWVVIKKGRKLKLGKDCDGYPQVVLYYNKKPKTYKVHFLVASTFIPNQENKSTVNHKDGIKTNNGMLNLEWAMVKENVQHSYDTGLKFAIRGINNVLSKPVIQYDMNLIKIAEFGSTVEAQRITGISRRCISYCANGDTKYAGGYIWKFKSDL